MMTFPTEWENKSHVPNHQPDGKWMENMRENDPEKNSTKKAMEKLGTRKTWQKAMEKLQIFRRLFTGLFGLFGRFGPLVTPELLLNLSMVHGQSQTSLLDTRNRL